MGGASKCGPTWEWASSTCLSGPADVEDILHDAQRMAEAARGMRSRAAILDSATGEVVPVEEANLGPRRQRHAVAGFKPVARARSA